MGSKATIMARLPGQLVPQADVLSDVGRTIDAIASGARTFQDIALAFSKGERQGRYYRKAAETMGLLENVRNTALLTPYGEELAAASGHERQEQLARAILRNPVVKLVLTELDLTPSGISRTELTELLQSATTGGGTTPARRMRTIWAWLTAAGYATEQAGRLLATSIPGQVYVEFSESLGGKAKRLTEVKSRVARRGSVPETPIIFSVDAVKRERANSAHASLVDDMSDNIRALGAVPLSNDHVDLFTEHKNEMYLFEMKSATPGAFHAQLRRGVAQLYEYAYMHRLPKLELCLVIEIPPPQGKAWLIEYLVSDRKIQVCWRTGGEAHKFACPAKSKGSIGAFL
jgi:hypothetical protein